MYLDEIVEIVVSRNFQSNLSVMVLMTCYLVCGMGVAVSITETKDLKNLVNN